MIGPKKKRSQCKKRIRSSDWHTQLIKKHAKKYQLTKCTHCNATKRNYRVCQVCGRYGDKQIITIKSKDDRKNIVDA